MTRRGSPEERQWRRRRNLEPTADGSQHGEQPVDPRGRQPREKPSGHRHQDPQPPEVHGSEAHEGETITEHGAGSHDTTVADNPHGNAAHSPPMVENAVGSPAQRREDRVDQPLPSDVAVGTISTIRDEDELQEVATDTDGDGVADTWKIRQQAPVVHRHTQHDGSGIPRALTTAADSRQQDIDNADFAADGTDDHLTIQNAVDALPVGTK